MNGTSCTESLCAIWRFSAHATDEICYCRLHKHVHRVCSSSGKIGGRRNYWRGDIMKCAVESMRPTTHNQDSRISNTQLPCLTNKLLSKTIAACGQL